MTRARTVRSINYAMNIAIIVIRFWSMIIFFPFLKLVNVRVVNVYLFNVSKTFLRYLLIPPHRTRSKAVQFRRFPSSMNRRNVSIVEKIVACKKPTDSVRSSMKNTPTIASKLAILIVLIILPRSIFLLALSLNHHSMHSIITRHSSVAQWKRAGLITQRSVDRNYSLLLFVFFSRSVCVFDFKFLFLFENIILRKFHFLKQSSNNKWNK